MKTIFRNQIIRIFSLVIILAGMVSFGVFIQSCSSDSEYDVNTDSEFELLIKSSEYTTLNNDLLSFGMELKSSYSKLSDTDKEKVITILNDLKDNSYSQLELEKLFEEFNSIMKIDFNETINRIDEDVVKLNLYREKNNISNKEFTLAVNKYSDNSIPRLRSGFENDDTTICVLACTAVAAVCLAACTGPQAMTGCHAACMWIYGLCCLLC